MTRTLMPAVLGAALFCSTPAHALELANPIREAGRWGIGFGGGSGPSGISTKYFFSKGFALQGVVGAFGWGVGWPDNDVDGFSGTGLGVQVDFLFELPTIVMAGDVMELGWCVGPGVWFGVGPDFWLGAAGTLGLEFNFIPVPIDLVLEYKPAIRFIEPVGFNPVSFGGHVRIYFM